VTKQRTGMVVSSVAHAGVIAYAVIGFTTAKPFDPTLESVAVEVLSPSEYDALTKGDRTSKKVENTPKVEAKKIAAVTPEPRPAAPEAKENVDAPPPPPDAAKVETPEPKPEPKKAETPPPEPPKEEPKKAETPPVPTPAPKPAETPKPEKKVDEKSQAKLDDLIKKEVEKKPDPPKKVEKKPDPKPQPKFDPSKIATMIDKRDPGRVAQAAPQMASITTAGISNGQASQLALTRATMLGNMIREQLYQCWSPPVGTQGMRDLMATIQFELTPQGVLIGQPSLQGSSANPAFQAFAESAMRAVNSCTQPTRPLRLPPEDYNLWKSVILDFKLPDA
jgi:colicin import membrane protein